MVIFAGVKFWDFEENGIRKILSFLILAELINALSTEAQSKYFAEFI